jgi:hypothetical protein
MNCDMIMGDLVVAWETRAPIQAYVSQIVFPSGLTLDVDSAYVSVEKGAFCILRKKKKGQ